MRRLALALSLALLGACAHGARAPAARRVRAVAVGEARFRVSWWEGDDRAALRVIRALERAAPRAQRWGPLAHEITVTVHRDHAALESAVQQQGTEWLRAWARHGTVDLKSPRSWGLVGPSDERLEELLVHELTHCALYQLAGDAHTWMYRRIPRWFNEGLASVTAGQAHRYASLEELWRFYREPSPPRGGDPGRSRAAALPAALPGDPLADPDPLYRERWRLAYGAAHHATEFLLRRYGEAGVRRLIRRMGEGRSFPAAFHEALGVTDAEFASDFRRYVAWEGWRR